MINDGLKLTGALTIALNDEVVQETKNLVVTAGKNWVADRMNDANTVMTHMAVGTGTTEALVTQTALVTENDRNALTSTTVTANAIAYVATWAAGDATAAITEAGIFLLDNNTTMINANTLNTIDFSAADSMTITWTITVS